MNTSRLALSADLGGALQLVHSAHSTPIEISSNVRSQRLGITLRSLIWMGCCLVTVAHSVASLAVTLAWDANPEVDIANYRLSYGTSSGSYTNVIDVGKNLEASVPNLVQGTIYYFAVSAVSDAGVQSSYSSEIPYYAESEIPSPNGWSLVSTDSEDPLGYSAAHAFDGDPSTFWHTTWRNNTAAPPPHEIQINLGSNQAINGFSYLPRQDGLFYGNVGQFEFYVSPDGANWGPPVATGTFPCTHDLKEVRFAATSGHYIKLRGLTDANGGPYMNVAELRLIQDAVPETTNRPPDSLPIVASVSEDSTLDLTLQGTDPDGNNLRFSVVVAPTNGVLSGAAPRLTYIPAANFNGTDSFTFIVNDGTVDSAPATVSITVKAVNDVPIALAKSVATAEDSSLPITLAGSDIEGSPLNYTLLGSPANGTLSGSAPNLTYQPAANFNGSDSFTFLVNDGTVDSAPAKISITIIPVNDPPLAISKSVVTKEDSDLSIILDATDPERDSLSFSVLIAPSNGTLTGIAPNMTYRPVANFTGADQFTFRVNDGLVDSAAATVFITVNPVNHAPVALARSITTEENIPLPITFTGTDADSDPLTFALLSGPANGILGGTAPNLTYQPAFGFNGNDAITFRVNDGQANSAPATVSIIVTAVNDVPLAVSQSVATTEDHSLPVTLTGSDGEGSPLSFIVIEGTTHGTLVGIPPNLTYLPAADYNGKDEFSFRVNDGTADSVIAKVSITITAVNDVPLATSTSVNTFAGIPLPLALGGTDPDSDSLSFKVIDGPSHGTLAGTSPNLIYSPEANFTGADRFTFRVNDGTIDSAVASVSITVNPANSAPEFAASLISLAATEDQSFAGQLLASDANEGDVLTFLKVSGPAWLSVSADGKLEGTPLNVDVGDNSFRVSVSDTFNASSTATLTITVENTNDAPFFAVKPLVYPVGTEKEIYLGQSLASKATDPDAGDTITYSKVDGPAWLVIAKSGTLSGTPPSGSAGTNLFTVRATDTSGESDDTSLQIKIIGNTLPLPWNMDNVGSGNIVGTTNYNAGVFAVAGSGFLADKQDSGNFSWQTMGGDGSITARVSILSSTGSAARVGVMIRESLAANSRQIYVGVDSVGNYHWLRRLTTGGSTSNTSRAGVASAAIWVRLNRVANVVSAYQSTNGTTWTKIGKVTVTLPKNCYVGLWDSSGSNNLLNSSNFSKVVVTP